MNTTKQPNGEKPARVALTGISTAKAHRQSIRRHDINVNNTSRMKTLHNKAIVAIGNLAQVNADHAADLDAKATMLNAATAAFKTAQSVIASSITKSVLKPNTAARKISRLAHKLKTAEATQPSATTAAAHGTKNIKKKISKTK